MNSVRNSKGARHLPLNKHIYSRACSSRLIGAHLQANPSILIDIPGLHKDAEVLVGYLAEPQRLEDAPQYL